MVFDPRQITAEIYESRIVWPMLANDRLERARVIAIEPECGSVRVRGQIVPIESVELHDHPDEQSEAHRPCRPRCEPHSRHEQPVDAEGADECTRRHQHEGT